MNPRHVTTILCLSLLFLAGCSHKYKTDTYNPPAALLSSNASAYIMVAKNGTYSSRTYAGSGKTVSQQTQAALARFLARVDMAPANENRAAAFREARKNAYDYVFEPVILHWEDRATAWSGKPDRISVKLVVWDPQTEEVVSTGIEKASSKWGTLGGDHPQDLLPRMMKVATERLFR
jgi:hypothetical protein